MELLWQPEIARVYLQLLGSSANVVTVEAALGSLQNLTACTWQVVLHALCYGEHAKTAESTVGNGEWSGPKESCFGWACTLALPGKYD